MQVDDDECEDDVPPHDKNIGAPFYVEVDAKHDWDLTGIPISSTIDVTSSCAQCFGHASKASCIRLQSSGKRSERF